MSLYSIIAHYRAETLATLPDEVLYSAQATVACYHDWLKVVPEHGGDRMPSVKTLREIFDFLENLLTVRYGCND